MTSTDDANEKIVLDLLDEALGADAAGRAEVLRRAEALGAAGRLKELLARADADGGAALTGAGLSAAAESFPPAEVAGYRVLREIGRGGMGAVYLARREKDDFQHDVAIKVVSAGAASDRLKDRLKAERRILAALKHPHIAQLYDGGETEDGAPYFVMEHVGGGKTLDAYLAETSPGLPERLRLFKMTCEAIAYAHRNLIIHRDLTPANILVDGQGLVKVIDFGIAQSLEDADDGDGAAQRLTMTRGYAAPERKDGAPASTATDIYSLGVILSDLLQGAAGPRLADVHAVAAKASATDPADRYQTVEALKSDVDAYERVEPVSAVGAGLSYALRRFLARRPLAASAGALAAFSLIIVSIVTTSLFLRARAAEERAVARFNEVRELANFVMFDLHDEVAKLQGALNAREKIVFEALDYLEALNGSPDTTAALKVEVAEGYKRLSDIVGNPYLPNLGKRGQAGDFLAKAEKEIDAALSRNPNDLSALRANAEIALAQARFNAASTGKQERGLEAIEKGFDSFERIRELSEPTLQDIIVLAESNIVRGSILTNLSRYDEAVATLEASRALLAAEKSKRSSPELQRRLGRTEMYLGWAHHWIDLESDGRTKNAMPHYQKADQVFTSLFESGDVSTALKADLLNLFFVVLTNRCNAGSVEEGLATGRRAVPLVEKFTDEEPENIRFFTLGTLVLISHAECLSAAGYHAQAIEAGEAALSRTVQFVESQSADTQYIYLLFNQLNVVRAIAFAAGDREKVCALASRGKTVFEDYVSRGPDISEAKQAEADRLFAAIDECRSEGRL